MYLKRKIFPELLKNLENNKIIILTGARQVGKTTLMKMMQEEVKTENNTAFIDMDIVSNQEYGESLENFLDFLTFNGYDEKTKRFYVFIDEFQRVSGMSIILKNIYDNYSNIKIIASGSSSLVIKNKIKESLAGRKFIFEIYPLDFEEFLYFKQDDKTQKHYRNIKKIKSQNVKLPVSLDKYLNEFIDFGGYPEVALSKTPKEKRLLLTSIFDLYIEKDILTFSGIENVTAFKKLVELLAVGNGQLINYDQLAKEIGIHNKTVRSYISLLEDTYLIKILKPYYTNKKKEVVKTPKIYFIDSGVRNYFLNNFNKLEKRVDMGQIWESYVLSELIKNNFKSIKFWRTKQKQEIDFIIEEGEVIPVEVKYKSSGNYSDYSNILFFMDKYEIKKGLVLSKNQNQRILKDKKIIDFKIAINFLHLFA